MRDKFQADLLDLSDLLVTMAEAVRTAMRDATAALLASDAVAARAVVAADEEIDAQYRRLEEKVYDVLALQAPVASDLRLVVTSLHVGADLERMGDLAEHVAKTALRRHPAAAVPDELVGTVGRMGRTADRIAAKIATVLSSHDATRAAELEQDDDAMDDLHRQLLATVLGGRWPHGVEAAVDVALLGRFYERYADHAVNAGNHVVYLVTGEAAADA